MFTLRKSEFKAVTTDAPRKTVLVFLDIDDTLINYNKTNKSNGKIMVWNGGGVDVWQTLLTDLKDKAKAKGVDIQFHAATFKKEFVNSENEKRGLRGDQLSAAVTEDEKYIEIYKGAGGIFVGHGLKKILDPKLPIIFTANQCKVKNAIKPLQEKLKTEQNIEVKDEDCWIFDDDETNVCKVANAAGHRAVSALGLSSLDTVAEEKKRIMEMFKPIYQAYDLGLPNIPIDKWDTVPDSKAETQLPARLFTQQPARLSFDPAQLRLEGIKGLDEDEPAVDATVATTMTATV